MNSGRLAGVVAGCLCVFASAHGETSADLKPGLWSVTMSAASRPNLLATHTMCIDRATERNLITHTSETPLGGGCSKYERHFTSTGATIDTVCTALGGTSTTHRVVTYAGDSTYTLTMHARRVQSDGSSFEDTLSEKGTWQGPCPSSMKPGDTTAMTVAPK